MPTSIKQKEIIARKLQCYPHPKFHAIFEQDRIEKGFPFTPIGKATWLNQILEHYYRNVRGENEMKRLLKASEERIKKTAR